ncbi:MAG: PTS system mannose/fructose/sorbose family transporter subunit IID [Paenibacillus macerans]|uniref:PTS system mannose/fructose/sorbose IID component family protein n=1 Tax=Paenibacillus macerans TaxID=44252 RepID=A0A090Z684_PAEMA|nr:PTS system mannose/fructose/sorbose family transporter subunit IID [Paenibacillus macerans]KFN05690.1 PTS system mannose/fructose/sorbose IID component family protein [Paenibacillus macerans]MBS5909999.1 PTS system mannose/fructose/sorbose family transporter subunit IID [Paenibacillus macerans]MCY7557995.1 PTS system mannose/fructose/sorbose family transporter subunit IID [Paenibacillus macerans]MDU7472768.1 PTS system mannose/fructose/sorbose family transporter subunit IID [Paenibacillus ma
MTETQNVAETGQETGKLITEKDVRRNWLTYYMVAEMGISYERLQALGFTTAMIPILKKLYSDPEDLKEALKRHLVFYNTEAVFGSPVNGIVIAMEEQKAKGEPITDKSITGMKTGLMGPLAGIGDSIDWATLKPIIFALAATLSATGSIIGPFVLLLLPLIQILVGLRLSVYGYRAGKASIRELLHSGRIKELIAGASTLGLFMMGALSSTYVKLSTPLQFNFGSGNEPFVLQKILDGIVPGLLPLLAVLGLYWWLNKKNQNFTVIMLVIIAISIIGAITGIF